MRLSKKFLTGMAITSAALLAFTGCSADSGNAAADKKGSNVATGEPIVLGATSPSIGAEAFPEVEWGLKAAEWHVNNELGGINGRPLKLEICQTDMSPESGVACANEFVEAGVPLVIDPYDPMFGAVRPIITEAGIPFAGVIAGNLSNEPAAYPEGFYFTGPLATTAGGVANIWRDRGVKKAVLAAGDLPTAHAYMEDVVAPIAKAVGVDLTIQYIDSAQANWSALAAAQLEGNPDMVGSMTLPEEGCTQLFGAIRQQDPDIGIFVGSCSQYVTELSPEEAAGTLTIPRLWNPLSKSHAPAEVAADIEAFTTAMDVIGHGESNAARATYAYSSVVTSAKALSAVDGEITPESATKALTSIKDEPMVLGPKKITCDGKQWRTAPTACSAQSIYFVVEEDGTLTPGNKEGYVDLAPEVVDALS